MKQLPIACTLDPEALRQRQEEVRPFGARMSERQVTETTFLARFESADVTVAELAQFVDRERECCRFLRFEITAGEDAGPVWLRISGPPGTGAFVQTMVGTVTRD